MLKRLTILALAILFVQLSFAQTERPDFKKIEKEIKDKNSPFFYETLMKRYNENDTTLSKEQYRYLYYGYSFQKTYSAYGKPTVNDDLKKAREAGDYDEVIELEKKALSQYPFNLRNLYRLSNGLNKKGDTLQADIYDKKLVGIAKAIFSTGDGASDSTAMYVISVEHEYDLIFLMGYEFAGNQSLVQGKYGPMDKMKLKKNEENLENLYFDVSILFKSMDNMFKKN